MTDIPPIPPTAPAPGPQLSAPPPRPLTMRPVPPAAPPPRKSFFRRFLTILALLILAGSLLLNCVLFTGLAAIIGGASEDSGRHVAVETVQSGGSDQIAVLPIDGAIDDAMVQQVRRFCNKIKEDKKIKAVILEINSPGGGITASDEIHHMLTDLRDKHQKRLAVSMRALAASGGYYVAVPAQKIYAERTTLTGSIGVIWPAFEITQMMEKIGVTPEIIKSSQASDYKDAASPFKKFTDKDREYIRGLVNHAHAQFKQVVEEGRRGKLKESIDQVAVGKIWSAEEALKLGLVDEIAYMDQIIGKLASDAGLSNPTVVRLKKRSGLAEIFGVSAAAPKIEVKVDAAAIRAAMQEATTPRLEYRVAP